MTSRPIIKIYGERNSGTNYLQRLMMLNFEAEYLGGEVPRLVRRLFGSLELPRDVYFRLTYRRNLGWKHSSSPDVRAVKRFSGGNRLRFATITKNPYAWLLSMYRRPYHQKGRTETFAEFLTGQWKTVGREQHRQPYENPIALWNQKNLSYLKLTEYSRCVNLRYEDLLLDPARTLSECGAALQVDLYRGAFTNIAESTKRDSKTFVDYQEYYLNERWKAKLDPSTIATIGRHLNRDVARRFGYSILDER